MSMTRIASLEEFQKEFDRRLKIARQGKVELTNGEYWRLQILRFVIVGGNGAFNALYGWSLGYNLFSCILLAAVLFSGDWALSVLHQITNTKQSFVRNSSITKSGLIFLSLVAGTSFMLGIKHAQDIKDSRIPNLEHELILNQEKFREFGLTKTATRVREIQNELQKERTRVGDFSPANAFPKYASEISGIEYEILAVGLNVLWIAVLLFTGMSLSAQLGMVWCPLMARRIGRALGAEIRDQMRLEQQQEEFLNSGAPKGNVRFSAEKKHVGVGEIESVGKLQHSTNRQARTRRPPYEEVKQQVQSGNVAPRQRSLTRLGMGAQEASKYLRRMKNDGILRIVNKRGDYAVVSY